MTSAKFEYWFTWNDQIEVSVGAACSRDNLNSRLQAAPTDRCTSTFQISKVEYQPAPPPRWGDTSIQKNCDLHRAPKATLSQDDISAFKIELCLQRLTPNAECLSSTGTIPVFGLGGFMSD